MGIADSGFAYRHCFWRRVRMNQIPFLSLLGLILCGAGGMVLNVVFRPALKLAGLFLLYLGGSVMLLSICSFQMCAALVVCGIGVVVLLGSALRERPVKRRTYEDNREWFFFRLLLSLMLGVVAYTASDLMRFWIPIRSTVLFISIWIGLMGLFGLSLDDEMPYRCIYLQSLCIVFTVCYIYMENSVLILAFLSVINLLMAFGGTVLSMGGNEGQSKEQAV